MNSPSSNDSCSTRGTFRLGRPLVFGQWWGLAMVVIVLALGVRLGGFGFFSGANLWAEDGAVFYKDAVGLGWSSLWKPYAGYLHLFQRVVALGASFFPLSWLPLFYNGGWLAGLAGLGLLVFRLFRRERFCPGWAILFLAGVVFLPVHPEVYFSLTNVQWFLGIAITLLVLFPERLDLGWPRLPLLGFLGLTGPFSILLAPVFYLRALISRFRQVDWWMGGVLTFCALVQVGLMMVSERSVGDRELSVPLVWDAMIIFVSMGSQGWWGWLGRAFFLALGVLAVRGCLASGHGRDGVWLLATGALFFASGLWASAAFLDAIDPRGWGGRYFFIPYAFSLLAIFWLTPSKVLRAALISFFLILSAVHFKPVQRPELHFQSFAWLASHFSEISIPIHPQWEAYPSWDLNVRGGERLEAGSYRVPREDMELRHGRFGGGLEVVPENGPVEIWVDIPEDLRKTPHLGVQVVGVRHMHGWASISLHGKDSEEATVSFRRHYGAGWALMRFALPYGGEERLRLIPNEAGGSFDLEHIELISDALRPE